MTLTIDSASFTPYSALLGGAFIGLASAILILGIGRISGISGIAASVFKTDTFKSLERQPKALGKIPWKITFLLGMVSSAWMFLLFVPFPEINISNNFFVVSVAGLLVGFGTRLGSGCTSGHGVCGLSRLSYRSFVATLCFMITGFFTVYMLRHVFNALT